MDNDVDCISVANRHISMHPTSCASFSSKYRPQYFTYASCSPSSMFEQHITRSSNESLLFQYCSFPQWAWFYITGLVVIVPSVISLIFNMLIFIWIHKSSKRIQPVSQSHNSNGNNSRLSGLSRRDLHLLRHAIILFSIFFVGWSPVYFLITLDYAGNVSRTFYVLSGIWLDISNIAFVIDLFIYNHELMGWIRGKLHSSNRSPTSIA